MKPLLLTKLMLLLMLTTGLRVSAQQVGTAVKGLVKNQSDEALFNVNVQVRDKKNNYVLGASTDTTGFFTFKTLQDGETYSFIFSHVGYSSKVLSGY